MLMRPQRGPEENAAEASRPEDSAEGQVSAAQKNRETQTRRRIVQALGWLGADFRTQWPDFVREFYRDPLKQTVFEDCALPPPFQPPDFDRLNQSPKDWAKVANAAWSQHRGRFLQSCQAWVEAGVDEEIPAAKQIRGPGITSKGERGKNTVFERRYVWAAKYLLRVPLKEIAAQDNADATTVGRVARATLTLANWLELSNDMKRASRARVPSAHAPPER